MSGHSKWATIKRKKAALDSKKGKEFTKITKEIMIAAKQGGGDPAGNARLRILIDKARQANMPNDNINRAIKKGTGELEGVQYEEHAYEGYGPHGVAIMLTTLTDNKNRTVAELRKLFSTSGGSLAENGSVQWMFRSMGVVRAHGSITEDALLEALLECAVQDIAINEESIVIYAEHTCFEAIKEILRTLNITVDQAQTEMVAHTHLCLEPSLSQEVYEFLETLEEHDDVQSVYANIV